MEGQQFPPELLQREVRARLGASKGTLLQQNFPSSTQLAGDIRGLLSGRVGLDEAVARANRNRRVNEIQRGGVDLFSDERPSNQERLQRTATPPTAAPPPENEPEQNLLGIRNRQAMATGKTFYYQKGRGQPTITPKKTFFYNYVDKSGIIGAEDRYPSGTPRVWRLLETYSGRGNKAGGSVLSLESEMRQDGSFPVPPRVGTHQGRATITMPILQDLVDGGQIGVRRQEHNAPPPQVPEPSPEPEPEPQRDLVAELRGAPQPLRQVPAPRTPFTGDWNNANRQA